jgi:site-specific DNA-methyltransferase (adenine-specific)
MTDIIWTNIKVRLGEIDPWQFNPRQSTKKTAAELNNTLNKFGQPVPLILNPKQGDRYPLIDGHQRYFSWMAKHGAAFEVDARIASRPLTDDERREYVIKFHAVAVGSWDADALSSWDTSQMTTWGVDAALLRGWESDIKTFKELLQSEQADGADAEPQTDRAAELLEKWQVQPGDLWLIGEHRLICGDCTDAATVARVMDGERADAVISDPPYGINFDTDYTRFTIQSGKNNKFAPIENDDKPFDPTPYLDYESVVLWGANYYADKLPVGTWLVWDKRFDNGKAWLSDAELAWMKGGTGVYIFSLTSQGFVRPEKVQHPTQKAVDLMVWCIEKSKAGELIYDPYAGSGTTLVACENLRRKCRAIEISPAYVAVALERLSTAFPALDIRRLDATG